MARHNNQLTDGSHNRGNVKEEAQPGCIPWGGVIPSFGATKWNNEKIVGLRRLPIDNFPHNNRPRIGIQDGVEYKGEV